MNIKAIFTEYCGPSPLFIESEQSGHTLKITYTIPALDPEHRYSVDTHVRNGLQRTLWHAIRRCAYEARNEAYRRTGHRDADMKELLAGRLVG